MINFKDGELTEEELEKVKEEIEKGKVDETLDLMDKKELNTFKDKVVDKEITFNKSNEFKDENIRLNK